MADDNKRYPGVHIYEPQPNSRNTPLSVFVFGGLVNAAGEAGAHLAQFRGGLVPANPLDRPVPAGGSGTTHAERYQHTVERLRLACVELTDADAMFNESQERLSRARREFEGAADDFGLYAFAKDDNIPLHEARRLARALLFSFPTEQAQAAVDVVAERVNTTRWLVRPLSQAGRTRMDVENWPQSLAVPNEHYESYVSEDFVHVIERWASVYDLTVVWKTDPNAPAEDAPGDDTRRRAQEFFQS